MLSKPESATYEFDGFVIDAGKRLLWNHDEQVALTPKAFDTLFYLVQNAGKTVPKDELMTAVWPDTIVEENNLNKNISVLRQLLGEKLGEHRFIVTIPGRGYKFVAPVVESSTNAIQNAEVVRLEGASWVPIPADLRGRGNRETSFRLRYSLVAILAIVLSATSYYFWRVGHPPNSGRIHTIAVLPFKPIAKEVGNEPMSFGMADSLVAQLGKSNDLVVRPLSETRRYADTDWDPREIGRRLGVDAVLDGSMQMSQDRIRITTRLIRTADGKQIWAGNFDEQMRDVFAVQDSITERVAAVLNATLGKQSRKRYTDDVESYQLFVLGQYTALKLTPEDHFKAIEYFRKAIDKDPKYALAYAGIAGTYLTYMLASDARPAETMPEAKAAALKAIELDDELPEAQVALGRVAMFYDWNWAEAEKHLLRAVDLDPNNSEGLLYLAHFYSNMGNHEKAVELAKRAQNLDPLTINRGALEGQFLFYAGRYDDAIDHLNQTIQLDPNHWLPRMFIARAYIEKGMYREAIAACQRSKELGSHSLELMALSGWSYAKLGETERARAEIREMEKISETRYVPPYFPALIHNALGEKEVAFSLLEKSLAAKDVRMTFLKVDPKWNNLRNEPRFIAIMREMKLE